MNLSKFTNNWSEYGILEEASGRRFQRPGVDFRQEAARICGDPTQQTAVFRTVVTPRGAVVCLPHRLSRSEDGI